jgi:hypothetical protein
MAKGKETPLGVNTPSLVGNSMVGRGEAAIMLNISYFVHAL